MPEKPLLIRKESFKHQSMDFTFLRELGIQCVQRLSGKIWTDYNHHDPGVTILEQLCYAIADLGFRTDFTIQDLLNAKTRHRKNEPNDTFFDASDILPTNPVSVEDYRILILDRVPYVKNVWIQPVRDNMQGIQGLYRIQLQVEENARHPETLKKIKQEVFSLVNQHRNLCEDIESIDILGVEPIVIYADIDIGSDVVAEEVLATILFKIEDYLNPPIKFYTLDELLDEGMPIEDIFDGPTPVHGFIKKSDLTPMRQEVYVSKIIELITGTEGVRRITFFNIEKGDIAVEGDVIQMEPGCYPILDMDTINEKFTSRNYPVQFYRGSLNYELDLNTTNQLLYSMYARYKKGYELKLLYNENEYPSVLRQDQLSKYYSIQNIFPITYGLNRYGLPSNERPTRERLAMVKQLRGYLMPFEQIVANYLAQLANIKQLFSIDKNVTQTYFSQIPDDIPEIEEMLNVPEPQGIAAKTGRFNPREIRRAKILEAFKTKLDAVVKKFDPFVDRRNRFLDHLLARFGEQFATDFLLKINSSSTVNTEDPELELINAKIEYLQNYIQISRDRGQGLNYLKPNDPEHCVSGLEKRACLLLHIFQSGNESLLRIFQNQLQSVQLESFSDVIDFIDPALAEGYLSMDSEAAKEIATTPTNHDVEERGLEEDELGENDPLQPDHEEFSNFEDTTDEFLDTDEFNQTFHSDENDARSPEELPSAVEQIDYSKKFVFRADSRSHLIIELLTNGIYSYNYVILPENKKETFAIYYKGNKQQGVFKVREAKSRLDARQLIDKFVQYLHSINKYSEGMHLVEHVLLRPQDKDRHYFILVNDREHILLKGFHLSDPKLQRYITDSLDIFGSKYENYQIKSAKEVNQILNPQQEAPPPLDTNTTEAEEVKKEEKEETPLPPKEEKPAKNWWEDDKDEEETPPTPEENNANEEDFQDQHEGISEPEDTEFMVVLCDDSGQAVAYHPIVFYSREVADDVIKNDLIKYIEFFRTSEHQISSQIRFYQETRTEANVDAGFYSQEVSIVMPNWPTRFQNSDFRTLLKNTIMLHCPVHLHIDFYWVGLEEMEEFEKAYFEWVYERSASEPRQPQLDEKAAEVAKLLSMYRNLVREKRNKAKK